MNAKNIIKAATIITILAVSSKLLGVIKFLYLVDYYGCTVQADAFNLAFSILEFLRHMIAGGTLAAAIIPIYRLLVVSADQKIINRAAGNLISLFSLILIITVLSWYLFGSSLATAALDTWDNYSNKLEFPKETWTLTIHICNIMFPAIIFFGIVSIGTAILNSFQHFAAPAATPGLLNIVIIICLWALHPFIGISSMAVGFLIGTLCQVILLYFPLQNRLTSFRLFLSFKDDYLKDIWKLLKPLLWGLLAYRFVFILNKFFASSTGVGKVSSLQYSEFLITGFIDVIGISLATAVYPTLSELFKKGEKQEFTKTTDTFLRLTILIALPIVGILTIFSRSIIEVFFQHGMFTASDTQITIPVLTIFAPTVLFQCFNYVIRNVFYARRNMVVPVIIAVSTLILNLILVYSLIDSMKEQGIVLAMSISYGLQSILMLVFLVREKSIFPIYSFLRYILIILLLTMISVVLSYGLKLVIDSLLDTGTISEKIVSLIIGICSFYGIFVSLGYILKIQEMKVAWLFIRRKLVKSRSQKER